MRQAALREAASWSLWSNLNCENVTKPRFGRESVSDLPHLHNLSYYYFVFDITIEISRVGDAASTYFLWLRLPHLKRRIYSPFEERNIVYFGATQNLFLRLFLFELILRLPVSTDWTSRHQENIASDNTFSINQKAQSLHKRKAPGRLINNSIPEER